MLQSSIISSARRRYLFVAVLINFCTCHAFPISRPSYAEHKSSLRYQLQEEAIADVETTPFQISSRLDPLLTSFLLRSVRSTVVDNVPDTNINPGGSTHPPHFTFYDASKAMLGLQIWETSLRKARLPLIDDFHLHDQNIWPEQPLFSRVYDALSELGMARLVRRHPEIMTSVLLGVAKVVMDFLQKQRQGKLVIVENNVDDDEREYNWEEDVEAAEEYKYETLSAEELDKLADSLANGLKLEWSGVVQGVSLLDKIFGYDHGLLDLQGDDGFGIQDGIWQHSGWRPMPDLQRRLSSMPELRDLLSRLGRRPSSKGQDNRRFRPRKRSYSRDDMMGVELDPLDPTSVSGLIHSGSLTTMLPSEALLLRSSVRSLRLLFLARWAESKLLSYELSGWTDVPTLPLPQTRRSLQFLLLLVDL